MKTRIMNGRDEIGRFTCTGKKGTWYTRSINWLATPALVYGILCALFSAYQIGGMINSTHIVEAKETVKVQELSLSDFPLLMKICKAESGGRQFKANGDVVRGIVNPSDIGYCQISESINNDEARRLGYDIYTEEGNIKMAIHLFLTKGYAPWMASHKSKIANGWSIE